MQKKQKVKITIGKTLVDFKHNLGEDVNENRFKR